jgi:hypothetical protein
MEHSMNVIEIRDGNSKYLIHYRIIKLIFLVETSDLTKHLNTETHQKENSENIAKNIKRKS